jgi:hypothetical protein
VFENLSEHDLNQLLNNALVMYRGKPIKVKVVDRKSLVAYDLLAQRNITIAYPFKDVVAPQLRIGNVNIGGNVFHITRTTPRVWTLGYKQDNLSINSIPYRGYEKQEIGRNSLLSLERSEIALAMLGKYPSFQQALDIVEDKDSVVAFDHQFSISSDHCVFYREAFVGSYFNKEIIFAPRYQYLKELVNEPH